MDGVILAHYWDRNRFFGGPDPLVVSADFLKYYQDDALPQTEAKLLDFPNSARLFHHFHQVAEPSLPADGKDSSPLEVSVIRNDLSDAVKPIVSDAADDIAGATIWGALVSVPSEIDVAGRVHFDKLCENFATFLETGLADGIADWPPNPW